MGQFTKEQLQKAKEDGFFKLRGDDDLFAVRFAAPGGSFTADQTAAAARLAGQFGSGKLTVTSRQSLEIPGIRYEDIDEVKRISDAEGLERGVSGPRIRTVTACAGTYCVRGLYDTQALAAELDEVFYKGWRDEWLPGRFKICAGGCPNGCVKPSINDFGIEGRFVRSETPEGGSSTETKVMYRIYLGGMWGRKKRDGTPYPELISREDIVPLLIKTLDWYRENGREHERLGAVIDRLGFDKFVNDLNNA